MPSFGRYLLASLEFCPEDAEELERWGMYAHQIDRVGFQVAPRSVGRTDSNRTRASSTAWYNVDDDLDHLGDPVVVEGCPF